MLDIRHATPDDAGCFLAYAERNRAFLAPFEPLRGPSFYDLDDTARRLAGDDRIQFGAWVGDLLVGQVAISNVSRAPVWLNCTIGYSVDEAHQRRGIATELVHHAVRHAFEVERLHRVEAGTLLHNVGSQRVLERCGFTRIGISPRHVCIAGSWQDHVLYAITNAALE